MSEIEDIVGKNKSNFFADKHNYCHLSSKSFVYSWTIAEFSNCLDFPNATVFSPKFNFENANWRLGMEISTKNKELNKIKLRLYKNEVCGNGYYIKYKISLFNNKGPFTTKETKSKFEGDNTVGSKVIFSYKDQKDVRRAIIKGDKLNILCELSVLTTFISKDSSEPFNISKQNSNEKSKVIETAKDVDILSKSSRSKRVYIRRKETKIEMERMCLIIVFCLLFVHLMEIYVHRNSPENRKINDLVVDTTLKVLNIADALNLTEIKVKSLELLSSYKNKYNISSSKFSKGNFSEIFTSRYEISNISDYILD